MAALQQLNASLFHRERRHRNAAFDCIDPDNSGEEEYDDGAEAVNTFELVNQVSERGDCRDDSDESEEESENEEEWSENHTAKGWRKKTFEPKTSEFPFELQDDDGDQMKSPLEYFKTFYPDNLFQMLAEQANIYFFQSKAPQQLGTNAKEIEMLVGTLFKMGVIQMPNVRDYYANETFYEPVASVMSRNRFQLLCRYLHFENNCDPNVDKSDKSWKLKPFLQILRENFLKVEPEEHQAVDEISIPYKGQKGPRQYNPKKPHKWHFTVFARAGSSGFVYDFFLYTGSSKSTSSSNGIGTTGSHVIRLCETLSTGVPFKVFADNFFVSLALVRRMKELGFDFTGTFRTNRIPVAFDSDKKIKNGDRGATDSRVHSEDNIIVVKWFDTRPVHLISTYAGVEETTAIRRYDRKRKEYINVQCPEIVTEYNKFMGGIDLMDSLTALYKYSLRSNRWTMFIWHHMTHVALVNAWLLHRRQASKYNFQVSYTLAYVVYRAYFIQCILRCFSSFRISR